VSEITGRLRPGLSAVDALGATFPAGSMTGAPKLRATQILADLEGGPRGIYSGAFGFLGFDGRADLAMVIRSIVLDAAGATIGAGGGITTLSVPEEEYDEMRLKARALLRALGVDDS
jgi:anthranilate synthase component 1